MDKRLKKNLSAGGRENRASLDPDREAPEDKFASSHERKKMWTDEWTQSALPNVPELQGWHLCWLSTTNGYDSIDKRMRLGYTPVKAPGSTTGNASRKSAALPATVLSLIVFFFH